MINIAQIKGKEFLEVQKLAGKIDGIVQHPQHIYKIMADHFGDTFFIARDESECDKILGFLLGFISRKIKGQLFIWQIGVSEAAQGKGIGSKLLEHTIDYGKKAMDCKAIMATVETTNKPSQHLFENFNFEIASSVFLDSYQTLIDADGKEAVENYYNSGTDQIFYHLELE